MLHARVRSAWCATILVCGIWSVLSSSANAEGPEVAYAGIAYSGDHQSIPTRFPYTTRFEETFRKKGTSASAALFQEVLRRPPAALSLVPQIAELKGRDQAVAVALVLSSETVSTEKFGNFYKLFVQLRGQVLFFDFKSMAVVRSYPLNFAYLDVLNHEARPEEIDERVRAVLLGVQDKRGFFARFAEKLQSAALPSGPPRFLQITKVAVAPEALPFMPKSLTDHPMGIETWLADVLAEAISSRTDTPLLPFAKGDAYGKLIVTVADGAVYELKLPKADYEFALDLTGLKKVKFGDVPAGTSFIYGAFAGLRLEDPFLPRVYLNAAFKNGETKVVPSSQQTVDDFPAFQDAIRGLFVKFSETLAGTNTAWLKSATATTDIDKQIVATRELLKSCR